LARGVFDYRKLLQQLFDPIMKGWGLTFFDHIANFAVLKMDATEDSVWYYFEQVQPDQVKCKHCTDYKRNKDKTGSTGAWIKHLKAKHPDLNKKREAAIKVKKEAKKRHQDLRTKNSAEKKRFDVIAVPTHDYLGYVFISRG
jgi:hypothetical protein